MRLSEHELERQRYRDRLRALSEAASLAQGGRILEKRGREEGIEIGREAGELVGRIQLLQRLLQQTETPKEELYRQPEEELLRLEESLTRQLGGKKESNGTPPAEGT